MILLLGAGRIGLSPSIIALTLSGMSYFNKEQQKSNKELHKEIAGIYTLIEKKSGSHEGRLAYLERREEIQ